MGQNKQFFDKHVKTLYNNIKMQDINPKAIKLWKLVIPNE